MISVEPRGHTAIIRLDRADKKNAMTPPMLASLAKAIETAASARAIVVSGVGETFCAGFDLTLCRDDDTALEALLTGLFRCVTALKEAPSAVVLSAHGAAIAGGCALLAAADIVTTTDSAKLGYPVVRLGISPAVSAPTLRHRIGDGPTRARLLDSGLIDGRRAVVIGLADESLPDAAACEARAVELAQQLAEKPPHAIGWTRRWLNRLETWPPAAAPDLGLQTSLALAGNDEQRSRLAALWARLDASKTN